MRDAAPIRTKRALQLNSATLQGCFTMATAWLDTIALWHPAIGAWWWFASFVFLLWLQLPWTDGRYVETFRLLLGDLTWSRQM